MRGFRRPATVAGVALRASLSGEGASVSTSPPSKNSYLLALNSSVSLSFGLIFGKRNLMNLNYSQLAARLPRPSQNSGLSRGKTLEDVLQTDDLVSDIELRRPGGDAPACMVGIAFNIAHI